MLITSYWFDSFEKNLSWKYLVMNWKIFAQTKQVYELLSACYRIYLTLSYLRHVFSWKNHKWVRILNSLHTFTNTNLEEGALKWELRDFLPWEDIHWDIFYEMKNGARRSFTEVRESIGVTFDTVKKHFYELFYHIAMLLTIFSPKDMITTTSL